MSGFAGHAVFPSIYRDMENPSDYNKMVNVTYQVTTVIYVFMAIIGYLMFGQESLQEVCYTNRSSFILANWITYIDYSKLSFD